jgi:hypothetical protein
MIVRKMIMIMESKSRGGLMEWLVKRSSHHFHSRVLKLIDNLRIMLDLIGGIECREMKVIL